MMDEKLWTKEDLAYHCSNERVNEAMALFSSLLFIIGLKLNARDMNEFTMHAMRLMNKIEDIEKKTTEEGIQ